MPHYIIYDNLIIYSNFKLIILHQFILKKLINITFL